MTAGHDRVRHSKEWISQQRCRASRMSMRLLRTSLPQLPAPPSLPFHFFPLPGLKTKKLLQLTYHHLENSPSLSLSSPWRIVQQNKLLSFRHRLQTSSLECCAQQHILAVLAALYTRHVLDVESVRAHMT